MSKKPIALTLALVLGFSTQAVAQDASPSGIDAGISSLTEFWTSIQAMAEEAAHSGELSPIAMYMEADIVVKSVMILLLVASVLVWLIFFGKILQLFWERARLRRGYRRLEKAGVVLHANAKAPRGLVGRMRKAVLKEVERSETGAAAKPGIKERVGSELARIEAGAARSMSSGTGFLANVGSSAPFIGLFGTVWGIMNSFISIAETKTTNLAVVAPGIAEALLATGIGLVAAIPAVIFYNLLARMIGGYKGMLSDAGALVERTLSRDLDARELGGSEPMQDAPDATGIKLAVAE